VKRPPLYNAFEWTAFRHWARWLYRIELDHPERVPASGPVILVANHESMLDPFLLGLVTARPVRYMAKAELWSWWPLGRILDGLGCFPVERGTGDTVALGSAGALLAAGEVLGMFPQGTTRPYRDRPWFRGAARLAIATGAPLVPVCIVGSEKALRPRKPKLGLPRIRLLVCEPIVVTEGRPTVAAARALTERLEAAIEEARAPYGPPAHVWFDSTAA
jgi:1-acyl-sn-glycerol-3-phosphate acyltransferase